ncbi:hypothetical protein [Oceanobacillus sp. CF4.6]|uniref:hypothetical protein n=1 Tax=Oceanobacillus sp. CF4.6 TaxID=3373080 RepID=UPI003EE6034B
MEKNRLYLPALTLVPGSRSSFFGVHWLLFFPDSIKTQPFKDSHFSIGFLNVFNK